MVAQFCASIKTVKKRGGRGRRNRAVGTSKEYLVAISQGGPLAVLPKELCGEGGLRVVVAILQDDLDGPIGRGRKKDGGRKVQGDLLIRWDAHHCKDEIVIIRTYLQGVFLCLIGDDLVIGEKITGISKDEGYVRIIDTLDPEEGAFLFIGHDYKVM